MKSVLTVTLICLSFGFSSAALAADESLENPVRSNGASAQGEAPQNETMHLNLLMIDPDAASGGAQPSALASRAIHPSETRVVS